MSGLSVFELGVLALVGLALAVAMGSWRERAGAAVRLVGWIGVALCLLPPSPGAQKGLLFAVDFTEAVLLGSLGWRAPVAWPAWTGGLGVLVFDFDVARLVDHNFPDRLYWAISVPLRLLLGLALVAGVLQVGRSTSRLVYRATE